MGVAQLEEHDLAKIEVAGPSPVVHSTANGSEWYAYNMTVNELITKLDLLPADARVDIALNGGGELAQVVLLTGEATEDGEDVVVLDVA